MFPIISILPIQPEIGPRGSKGDYAPAVTYSLGISGWDWRKDIPNGRFAYHTHRLARSTLEALKFESLVIS